MQMNDREIRNTLNINGKDNVFCKHKVEKVFGEDYGNESVANKPSENKWFKVDPKAIKRELFNKPREDKQQEKIRQLILEAFQFVDKEPEKYGRQFETFFPQKNWKGIKAAGCICGMAKKFGDHNADFVEQALEWAQRICNGETWKEICNKADIAPYYRLVIWKNSGFRVVGGSAINGFIFPATFVYEYDYYCRDIVSNTVPLVVKYIDE